MNCKPGDIAIVVGDSVFAGRLFEVLYAAPPRRFYLPDGQMHEACRPGEWVLRSFGGLVDAQCEGGLTRKAMYGCGRDSKPRPLRGVQELDLSEAEACA